MSKNVTARRRQTIVSWYVLLSYFKRVALFSIHPLILNFMLSLFLPHFLFFSLSIFLTLLLFYFPFSHSMTVPASPSVFECLSKPRSFTPRPLICPPAHLPLVLYPERKYIRRRVHRPMQPSVTRPTLQRSPFDPS